MKTDTEIVDSCEHVAVDAVLSFFTETYPVLRCSKCNAFLGYKYCGHALTVANAVGRKMFCPVEVVDEPV